MKEVGGSLGTDKPCGNCRGSSFLQDTGNCRLKWRFTKRALTALVTVATPKAPGSQRVHYSGRLIRLREVLAGSYGHSRTIFSMNPKLGTAAPKPGDSWADCAQNRDRLLHVPNTRFRRTGLEEIHESNLKAFHAEGDDDSRSEWTLNLAARLLRFVNT
jgi:hypothetical protein